MTKLPVISGRECVKALQHLGFVIKRQEGSPIILRRESPFAQVVVQITGNWTERHFAQYCTKRGSASRNSSRLFDSRHPSHKVIEPLPCEKVAEELDADGSEDGLGVELHAFDT